MVIWASDSLNPQPNLKNLTRQDTSPRNRPLQSSTLANTRDKDAIINALRGQVPNPCWGETSPVKHKLLKMKPWNQRRSWHLKQKIPELDNTDNNHICNKYIYIHINHLFFVNYVLHTEQTQLSFISISTPTSKKTHHISMTPHDFLQVGWSSGLRSEAPCNTLAKPCQQSNGRHGDFHLKKGRSKWVSRAFLGDYFGVSWWNKRLCKIVDTPMLKMYKKIWNSEVRGVHLTLTYFCCYFRFFFWIVLNAVKFFSCQSVLYCVLQRSTRTLSHVITYQPELLVIGSSAAWKLLDALLQVSQI